MKRFSSLAFALLGAGMFFVMGAALRDDYSERQAQESNRQLKRIADSLEIIAGQRSGWKLPKQ